MEIQKTASEIQEVTVFLSGARIKRRAAVSITEKQTTIQLTELSDRIIPDSILVTSGNASVENVEYEVCHIAEINMSEKSKQLICECDELSDAIVRTQTEISIYEQQLRLVTAYCASSGENHTLEMMKELSQYFMEQNRALHMKLLELNREKSRQQKKLENMQQAITDSRHAQLYGSLKITVDAEVGAAAELTIEYFDLNASWEPYYNLMARDDDETIRLLAKARVIQSTGEKWNDVPLILSTGVPQSGLVCPQLSPWYLNNQPAQKFGGYENIEEKTVTFCELSIEEQSQNDRPAVQMSQMAVEFAMPQRLNLDADKEISLEIQEHQLPVKFVHQCIPKLEKTVYLIAQIKDWDELNIQDGNCNLFYNGSYVGKTQINQLQNTDTVDIPLGKDSGIVVTRTKHADGATKSLLGNQHKITHSYELSVRNTKNITIHIKITDQLPVSEDSAIKVTPLETSGAAVKESGQLSWDLTLKAGESITKQLRYSISYPGSMQLKLD